MIFACGATPTTPRPLRRGGDDPGDVRAVAVAVGEVLAGPVAREVDAVDVVDVAVVVVVDAVAGDLAEVRPDVRREVGVVEPRAGVDDRDRHAGARARAPTRPGRSSTLPGATAHCSPCGASSAASRERRDRAGAAGQKRARSDSVAMPSRRGDVAPSSRSRCDPARGESASGSCADPRERAAAATCRRGSRAASPSSPGTWRCARSAAPRRPAGRSPPALRTLTR